MYCSKERNYCAHGRNKDGGVTCYSHEELKKIVERIKELENNSSMNFKMDNRIELWKDIAAYMKTKYNCLDELCWVETLKLAEIEKNAFKPKLPKEWIHCDKNMAPDNNCMNTWLSNYEIDNVLQQFEKNVPYFEYLGSVPMDFAQLPGKKINHFSIKDCLNRKKTKIGMVFNTDPSTRPGQHWICAFIDLKSKEINFFDSYGSNGNYPEEVEKLFIKIQNDAKKNKIQLVIKKNTVRHQYKNSECGVYCIKFIADRLNNSFEKLTNEPVPDEEVNKERWDRFFRTEICRPNPIKF